ncbi:MAG TPA: V-type ATPase subunit, partial [Methanocorpusculum sp.]|nr:V-type ATPase subunit [Methanocorpusculum sp.]
GKQLGFSNGKIKAVLVPAGSLDAAALDHMLSEPTIERIVETLPDKTMSGIISEKLSAALEKKSFSEIENDLYKHYYAALLRAGRNGMKDGRPFIQYVRSEIDCVNILNLFRIRAQGAGSASSLDVWIEGGTFTPEELERLVHLALEEAVDSLKKEIKAPALLEALDGLREKKPIYAVGSILTAAQLEQMSRISKRYPFSIAPLMVYLERKRFEVTNLRALARGKEAGLDAETLEMYLVM